MGTIMTRRPLPTAHLFGAHRPARALLMLALSLALASSNAPGQRAQTADKLEAKKALEQAQLKVAEDAVVRTREAWTAASEAVEILVRELGLDYHALTAGPDASALQGALVLALVDTLDLARARIAAATAKGRAPMRTSRAKFISEAFRSTLRQTSGVDERLSGWVADQVATSLSARSRQALGEVGHDGVQQAVRQLFVKDESWYVFWNRSFHQGLSETATFAQALQAYEDAGLALDRLRHPERYDPRGEPAPSGMLIIPGGSYTLGPNPGWNRARRTVQMEAFALDRREVTHREYAAYVDSRPAANQQDALPRGWSLSDGGRAQYAPELRQHPVKHVTWSQAAGYAAWAGKRLPTENEWEAAAGGPESWAYPWGNAYASGRANGAGEHPDTLPVESYPDSRSASGCFDLAGNVWEWTATLEDGRDIETLPEGLVNIAIRGGAWNSPREELATRYRWTAPGHAAFASPRFDRPIGFRCAKDL
jgi:formylglycine-generating enzyme required for sulfatase activity